MKQASVAFLLLGTACAAPAISVKPRETHLDQWPEFCDESILTGKTKNKVWTEDNIGTTLQILASTNKNYANFIEKAKGAGTSASFTRYIAEILGTNFNWKCDSTKCMLDETTTEKCKKNETSGKVYLFLDSTIAYWNYIHSFKESINDARNYISGRLPSVFTDFGGVSADKVHWTEAIGLMTAGAGTVASLLPGNTGIGAGIGLDIVNTIADSFKPVENTEKKFDGYAVVSTEFTENVDILTNAINDYLKHEFEDPLDWDRADDDQVHAVHNAIENDFLYKAVMTGDFAGLDTPRVDQKDATIRAALMAPIINAIWRDAKNYVVKFDRAAWEAAGIHICAEDAFTDLRAEGDMRIGCGDDQESLYMIAHWGFNDKNFDQTKVFRDVKGIDTLAAFDISRADIIAGSIKNFDDGGFNYLPGMDEILKRINDAGNKNNIVHGLTQVWNLPFCVATPTTLWKEDLESSLAHHALMSCENMKDKNGKEWPYKEKE